MVANFKMTYSKHFLLFYGRLGSGRLMEICWGKQGRKYLLSWVVGELRFIPKLKVKGPQASPGKERIPWHPEYVAISMLQWDESYPFHHFSFPNSLWVSMKSWNNSKTACYRGKTMPLQPEDGVCRTLTLLNALGQFNLCIQLLHL